MLDPKTNRELPPSSPKKSGVKALSLFLIVIGMAAAALLYTHFRPGIIPGTNRGTETGPVQTAPEVRSADTAPQEPALEQKQEAAQPPLKVIRNPAPDDEPLPDNQGLPRAPVIDSDTTESTACTKLAEELHLFFVELDHKHYFQAFNLDSTAEEYFISLVNKLLDNPPVVSRETDDLYTLLTNMAHFFRILGKDNIILIKGILDRERDVTEDFGLALYQWIISKECTNDIFPLQVSLQKVYEYAGFFLNTMGGRSYLFRRDSRSRLLVNYYAILIIDQVNKAELNLHGIHIPDFLPLLISEIEASNQLIYKELYLDRLYDLAETYQ